MAAGRGAPRRRACRRTSATSPRITTTRRAPETAQNQLDYVFASRGFHENVTVRALNAVEEWGASDHCRLLIEIAGG
ncbi:MAG: hypothetical protein OXG19_03480 [Chloroflexi bacterium]|nr:hypothetical protein [Chloroflexota bacterium]